MRADAQRNIAAILDAAAECLGRDPEVSIAGIAAAAGVGRITLYGHFRTRADLVDAVLVRTVQQCDAILDATDTTGDPAQALARLVASSWQLVHQFRNILLAAQRELPAERIRGVHDRILRRVQSLVERGQRAGAFRRDLPRQWLVTAAYSLMHAAAEDTAAGRLEAAVGAGGPPVVQAVACGVHLAGVAAEPGQVPGGVLGADVSFGCQHGVSFAHASRRPIRMNPAVRAAAAYRQNTPNPEFIYQDTVEPDLAVRRE